jgi:cell division protein FtsB
MKFGKQNQYKSYLYSRPTAFLLFIVTVLLSMSVYERFTVERDMSQRRAKAESELKRLHDRMIQIDKRVEYLEGERGIEEEIRKNFDVAKEGEQVIILTGEEPKEAIDVNPTEIEPTPWYMFWR